jgi:putative FmdB family regulatory protein
MPMYEYTCHTCEHSFETLVFDGETVTCPSCESPKLNRLLSLPARPRAATPCASDLPPCGPACCRLPAK